MTLPASGAISLNDVNVELGLSGTTSINMNQASVRTLFGVASGAISMSDGYGKANQFSFTISTAQTNANLATLATAAGWNGTSKVVATIGSGIVISSTSTGTPALTVNGSFAGGVELINTGTIVGRGGTGGAGGGSGGGGSTGKAGASGGTGLSVSVALTLTNGSGTISGGGGGGGGGAQGASKSGIGGGGGGGGGGGNGTGGALGTPNGNNGSTGGTLTGGAGGTGGFNPGGSGGTGGTGGTNAASGANGTGGDFANGSGGGGGAAISGNSNITYVSTGTRYGTIT